LSAGKINLVGADGLAASPGWTEVAGIVWIVIVTVYLSSLRPAEVLSLEVGCCPEPAEDGSGAVHYRLFGNFRRKRESSTVGRSS
jgi:hypothetical protein